MNSGSSSPETEARLLAPTALIKWKAKFFQRIKEYALRIFLVCLGILVPLLAAEVAVRFLDPRLLPPQVRDVVRTVTFLGATEYITDSELGFTFRPGTDFQAKGPEYSYRFKLSANYNGAGFRGGTLGGPAWGLAVGDSFTFGDGVDQESTWIAQLANLTSREIINLGVPGYGPQQYTRIIERYGISLRPRVIFYCLFTNDLRDAEQFAAWKRHPTSKFSVAKFLRNHSVFANLYHRWRRQSTLESRYVRLEKAGLDLSVRKLGDEINADSARLRTVWPLIAREIDKASEDSRQINARLVVLYFPSKEEVYWESIKSEMKNLESFNGRIHQLRNTTMELCRSRPLLCFDLTPSLEEAARHGDHLYFSTDIHWNPSGHKLVASAINRFLLDEKLL